MACRVSPAHQERRFQRKFSSHQVAPPPRRPWTVSCSCTDSGCLKIDARSTADILGAVNFPSRTRCCGWPFTPPHQTCAAWAALRHRLPSLREASRSRPICVLAVVSHVWPPATVCASNRLRICTSRRWRRPSRAKKINKVFLRRRPMIHVSITTGSCSGITVTTGVTAILCPEHGHPTCATVQWLCSQEGQRRTATVYVVREIVPGVAADVAEPLRCAITVWVRLHHTRHIAVTSGAKCATFHRGAKFFSLFVGVSVFPNSGHGG